MTPFIERNPDVGTEWRLDGHHKWGNATSKYEQKSEPFEGKVVTQSPSHQVVRLAL